MGLDSDLIGVIAGCTVVGVLLCVVVVITGCNCYRRLESKRRKKEAHQGHGYVTWAPYPAVVQPGANHGSPFHTANRITGYRPRIFPTETPRHSTTFNKLDASNGVPGGRKSPSNPLSSTPYHDTNAAKFNGHVLFRIPVTNAFMVTPETADFYDSRAWHLQYTNQYIEAGYLPSHSVYTSNKEHHKESAAEIGPSAISTDNDVDSHLTQQPQPEQQQQQQNHASDTEGLESSSERHRGGSQEHTNDTQGEPEADSFSKDTGNIDEQGTLPNTRTLPGQEDHPNNTNYKVIRKQHGHVKMPDWMVREYEETGKSIEMEGEEDTQVANEDEGMVSPVVYEKETGVVSVMVKDYSVDNAMNDTEVSDQQVVLSSTIGEGTTTTIHDYSSTNYIKDFTILDYIDPPQNQVRQIPNKPDGETSVSKEIDPVVLEHKAAVLKQIRQKVNESAERVPPVFTSTPRVEVESVGNGASERSHDDVLNHRQRQANDGSMDVLPPAGDTQL